jgi:hypothetical protein
MNLTINQFIRKTISDHHFANRSFRIPAMGWAILIDSFNGGILAYDSEKHMI